MKAVELTKNEREVLVAIVANAKKVGDSGVEFILQDVARETGKNIRSVSATTGSLAKKGMLLTSNEDSYFDGELTEAGLHEVESSKVDNEQEVKQSNKSKNMKANNSRKVGDIHSNGKWMWTEYSEGKFDWRTIKTQSAENKEVAEIKKEEPKEKSEVIFANKKDFVNGTEYDLTKEECEIWYKNFGKESDVRVCNRWSYLMGRIGSCSVTIENSKTGKSKDFSKHPDWRPLAHYSYSVRGWSGESINIEGYCQSWEEIQNSCSSTENMTFYIQKHPHQ